MPLCNISVRFLYFQQHIRPCCTSERQHKKHKADPVQMICDTTKTPETSLFPHRCRSNINWRDCIVRICCPPELTSKTIQMPFHNLVPFPDHSNAFCLCDTKHKNAYPQTSYSDLRISAHRVTWNQRSVLLP